MDDELEQRALEEPEAQRALLAQRADEIARPALLDATVDPVERGSRALELLASLGVDPRTLGGESGEHAATIARHLARNELASGRARSAIAHLHAASRWQDEGGGTVEARAEAAADLARAHELLGDEHEAGEAWTRALALARSMEPCESRSWIVKRSADSLAERARRRDALDEARSLEDEWTRADDEDIARQLAALAPALDFFSARWDADAPPSLRSSEAWRARSTGRVRTIERDPSAREGLGSAQIFGSDVDFVCLCGALSGRSNAGAVCDECGVEVSRAARSIARIGHIELPVAIFHPAALSEGPAGSLVALALDLSSERLSAVLRGARCLRRAARAPRGADTVEPDSVELREYDEGRGDPSVIIAAGYQAVLEAIEALDVDGALGECQIELRALEAHRAAKSAAVQQRLASLNVRRTALELLAREGVGALVVEAVPVWSRRWMSERGCERALVEGYVALIERCDAVREPWAASDRDRAELTEQLRALCARFIVL
ncbi:MAG: hypothetical protein U0269_09720 [Polyangiales bacterium]